MARKISVPIANQVTLEASRAKYLAVALAPAAARNDITPVLSGVHLSIEKGNLRGVSSDRYRVHAVLLPVVGDAADDFEALLPRDAIAWLTKNAGAFSRRGIGVYVPVVVIEVNEGRVTIRVREDAAQSADEVTYTTSLIKGTFPPVMKLIAAARDSAPISSAADLTPDLLASVRALGVDAHRASIKFTGGTGAKKGPAYIKVGDHAEALIQPHASDAS